jgi:hypothetical protein
MKKTIKPSSCPNCTVDPLLWHVIIKGTDIIIGWIYECPKCKKSAMAKTVRATTKRWNRTCQRESNKQSKQNKEKRK